MRYSNQDLIVVFRSEHPSSDKDVLDAGKVPPSVFKELHPDYVETDSARRHGSGKASADSARYGNGVE